VENIEGKLARQGTDLGQARRAVIIRVEDVQGALPSGTVLIEYVRYSHYLGKSKFESHYGAVVLSADARPRWVALGNARDIEATLKRYQRLVRKASDEEIAAILRKAYNAVWEPVEQAFPAGANRVTVSPDGELNFLSFATLLDPERDFVAEKYLIQYVTSGRDLLREPQPTLSKQVIVMANPKFDRVIQPASGDPPSEDSGVLRGAEKRDIEDLSFEELGGTEKESAQLSEWECSRGVSKSPARLAGQAQERTRGSECRESGRAFHYEFAGKALRACIAHKSLWICERCSRLTALR